MKKNKTADRLKAKRLKWVFETIAHWKKELNLHGWEFLVNMGAKIDAGNAAEIMVQTEYERASLLVGVNFWDDEKNSPEFREQMIVHELCHCLTEECYDLLLAQYNDRLVTRREIDNAKERLTERIAKIVCPIGDEP